MLWEEDSHLWKEVEQAAEVVPESLLILSRKAQSRKQPQKSGPSVESFVFEYGGRQDLVESQIYHLSVLGFLFWGHGAVDLVRAESDLKDLRRRQEEREERGLLGTVRHQLQRHETQRRRALVAAH